MSQCTEIPVFVNICHGTNSLRIIPDPDTDLILSRPIPLRFYSHIISLSIPPDGQDLLFSAAVLDSRNEVIFSGDFRTV